MFNFEHKEYLLLLLILPILLGLYLLYNFRRKRDIRKLGNPEVINLLMPDYSQFRNNLKIFLLLLAVGLIIVALAGPRFGSRLTQVKQDGIDIIIALDVSNSMLAEDIKPNRLERAKQELSRLLDRLENDRIGLIVFAGDAYTQIPITNDYLSAKIFLSGISTEMISRQGTAIGDAIDMAIRSFNPESKAGKAIVIISDGENHEGGVTEACDKASDKGIRIFTVGMGHSQGSRIPAEGNNANTKDYRRDRDGNFVVTKLNEQMLQEIARNGDGKYYRASSPDLGLNSLLSELNKLDKTGMAYTEYSEYEEQFQGVIWIALGLLVLEFIIMGRKNKWLRNIKLFDN
ncbi:MAG TPA: VWA domain-containing protein [Bacteroidales bacterium]|nr:VWA domain-containing protein [Bacteroidales bacterium]